MAAQGIFLHYKIFVLFFQLLLKLVSFALFIKRDDSNLNEIGLESLKDTP